MPLGRLVDALGSLSAVLRWVVPRLSSSEAFPTKSSLLFQGGYLRRIVSQDLHAQPQRIAANTPERDPRARLGWPKLVIREQRTCIALRQHVARAAEMR